MLEKTSTALLPGPPDPQRTRQTSRTAPFLKLVVIALATLVSLSTFSGSIPSWLKEIIGCHHDGSYHDGAIHWHPCHEPKEGFKCATISVPLDYHDTSIGNASIAVIIYPTDAKDRQGSIFTNPGGPGSSGYDFITRIGPELQLLTGGKHDIIGFDPRGIGRTKPTFRCFTNKTQDDLFALRTAVLAKIVPHGNLTDPMDIHDLERQISKTDAAEQVLGTTCADPEGAGKYMSTAHVVRDIEYMARLLEGDKPVNYWGFSYGTSVGTYFTAMFPQRVGKLVIDAVMAVEDWWSVPHHVNGAKYYISGTEDSWETFLLECAKAGPRRCALAKGTKNAAGIGEKVDDLLERLHVRPLPVLDSVTPGLLLKSSVRAHMFMNMYKPKQWTDFAVAMQQAVEGNGTLIYDAVRPKVELDSSVIDDSRYAGVRVGCSDAPPFSISQEDVVPMFAAQLTGDIQNYSRHFSGGLLENCWNWDGETSERFAGPIQPNLSNPMVIIGNTHDCICPLQNAEKLHKEIRDSRLIVQNSPGHCSIAQASICTLQAIQSYFVNNTLWDDTLYCEPSEVLFPMEGHSVSAYAEGSVPARILASSARVAKVQLELGGQGMLGRL